MAAMERKSFDPYNTFVVFKNTRRSNKRQLIPHSHLQKQSSKDTRRTYFHKWELGLNILNILFLEKPKYFIVIGTVSFYLFNTIEHT